MTTCPGCDRQIGAQETTWPSDDLSELREICQDCWEKQCDKSWWEMVAQLPDMTQQPSVSDSATNVAG